MAVATVKAAVGWASAATGWAVHPLFLIRLGSQNERDGQRDRGPEDGTMVQGV